MCYAIPGKIEKIENNLVTVDYFGEKRNAYNELENLFLGDYIYAQGGYVINKISNLEAESILATWKEEFFELQKVDLRLSRIDLEKKGIDKKVSEILDRILENKMVKPDELGYLLAIKNDSDKQLLFKTANFSRSKNFGNSCCVHGIIEISNHCKRNCYYCGISNHNRKIIRYRMDKEEILEAVREAVEVYGFKALVLQSAEDLAYKIEELADIIKEIKKRYPVLIFISFGEIGIEGLRKLYEAGARGLLLRFETSNQKIYEKLHPGYCLDTRLEHLKKAFEIGYLLITGSLIGLPGQTREDLVNDILLAKELNAEMFSFGPFLPSPNTPLENLTAPLPEDIFKILSIARLVDQKKAKILITTAFETLDISARKKGLLSGANSVMLNVTPLKYRQLYSIYPKRAHENEEIDKQINETIYLLRDLGRSPTDLSMG
ncbi:MAG: [FeFe] hydrogenase H-cluster radical SAM maturase HydE [Candidatus Omnitrophota bacterium]